MIPLRIGHRGAAGYAPENTISSVEKAIALGVDAVEIDVQITRDGALAVMHDCTVDRTTDGHGYVRDLLLEDLRRLRTSSGGQPVPTLAEVLGAINGRAALMIEMKASGIAAPVAEAVRQAHFRSRVFYASFQHDDLLQVREIDRDAQTIALFEGVPVDRIGFLRDARATHAGIALGSIFPGFTRVLQEAGFQVFTYTANEPGEIAWACHCNVNGIISNYPDRLPKSAENR
jgi:glycerophosphoryl diester phosphodiesterase